MKEEQLSQILDIAENSLAELEKKAAIYTVGERPVELTIALQEKRLEVENHKARLKQIQQGIRPIDALPHKGYFVGRKEQIEKCLRALKNPRLLGVMIDGPGGIGKTALAIEVTNVLKEQEAFEAYIYISAKTTTLDLTGIHKNEVPFSSLDTFLKETARQLRYDDVVRDPDPVTRREALMEKLTGRRILLFWDNLETLSPAENGHVITFLMDLPSANKAIITSRQRANDIGLVSIHLEKLEREEVLQFIDDFVNRTASTNQQFKDLTTTSLNELYTASGGNPLVLNQMLGLIHLKGYTLSHAVEILKDARQSKDIYEFLFAHVTQNIGENEKAILSALAFQPSSTLAILEHATNLPNREVQSAVSNLVTLSIVSDPADGQYSLQPLVRNYVRSALLADKAIMEDALLENVDIKPQANTRMLEYWLNQALNIKTEIDISYQKLETDWPNIEEVAIALYDLAEVSGNNFKPDIARKLLDLTNALCLNEAPLLAIGYWDECLQLAYRAYNAAVALHDWETPVYYIDLLIEIYHKRNDIERIQELSNNLSDLENRVAENITKPDIKARYEGTAKRAIRFLTMDPKKALAESAQEIERWRKTGNPYDLARSLYENGILAFKAGKYLKAQEYYEEALTIAKETGNRFLQTSVLINMGDLALGRTPSITDNILRWVDNAVGNNEVLGWVLVVPFLILWVPSYFFEEAVRPKVLGSDPEAAKSFYLQAYELATEKGFKYQLADAHRGLAEIANIKNDYQTALHHLYSALPIYEMLKLHQQAREVKNLIRQIEKRAQKS